MRINMHIGSHYVNGLELYVCQSVYQMKRFTFVKQLGGV